MAKITCRIIINNEDYWMYGGGTYTDENNQIYNLKGYKHVGMFQDSLILGHSTEYGDFDFDPIRYFPHGHHNEEGNKISIYSMDCDEVTIVNETGEVLLVEDEESIPVGEEKTYYLEK